MSALKLCVAGHGQRTSIWLSAYRERITECTVEEPQRCEHIDIDREFADHFLLVPINPKHGPKTTTVCPYLTLKAAKLAASAMRDYRVTQLGMALILHYGWQVANGAKPLPERGALAKVYVGSHALYLYERPRHRPTTAHTRAKN